jgi:hypothetical protein
MVNRKVVHAGFAFDRCRVGGRGAGVDRPALTTVVRPVLDQVASRLFEVVGDDRDRASEPVATVIDQDGRTVELTLERWAHITDGHPELTSHQKARAVRRPS